MHRGRSGSAGPHQLDSTPNLTSVNVTPEDRVAWIDFNPKVKTDLQVVMGGNGGHSAP
jgi:hypothetical protein